jgi:hypothetical protein
MVYWSLERISFYTSVIVHGISSTSFVEVLGYTVVWKEAVKCMHGLLSEALERIRTREDIQLIL